MKSLKKLKVEAVAKAIEADAGHALPGLRESLAEAKAGKFARVHTPEVVEARRKRGRPVGSVQAVTKEAVKLRLDADVLAALRATGDGWQTRINDTLRASMALAGSLAATSETDVPLRRADVVAGRLIPRQRGKAGAVVSGK